MGLFDKIFNKKKKVVDFPPKPKWKPNLPINLNLILEKSKYYTGEKLQLAVFEFGTIIIFSERVTDIISSALQTLDKIYNFHPDFNPREMDDGNYLIEYSQPAFTIVFKDEIEKYWSYIDENHLDGICTDEVLINGNGEHNVFDKIGKICLYGRSKMFMDAQNPKVVLTFDNLNK
ncbi:hypothetical protein J1N10_15225 [Carboxylicivirga sp. A043]|uniref:hypothetical protein n=1 Tax=Carboxylicivirga litoralis TaxID=2816963 RepID=UPI0021CB99F5|nr:hypothetical protein [Carboxylicivirga sp. A043]MCU4157327.1 hypothetical protein [Carboxylicivirga sp. A043]